MSRAWLTCPLLGVGTINRKVGGTQIRSRLCSRQYVTETSWITSTIWFKVTFMESCGRKELKYVGLSLFDPNLLVLDASSQLYPIQQSCKVSKQLTSRPIIWIHALKSRKLALYPDFPHSWYVCYWIETCGCSILMDCLINVRRKEISIWKVAIKRLVSEPW